MEVQSLKSEMSQNHHELRKDFKNAERLIQLLERYALTLRRYGHNIQPTYTKALEKLRILSDEKVLEIIASYETCLSFIVPSVEHTEEIIEMPLEKEIAFAKKALEHYGFYVSDEFWKTVSHGQIIEIYGLDMRQYYRSMNFFKYTSYSLLDLAIYEWYVLYERANAINEAMNADVASAIPNGLPVVKMKTPPHILKELLNTGDSNPFIPRANLLEFQYIGAVKSHPLHSHASGLICTSTVSKISEGNEVNKIMFI